MEHIAAQREMFIVNGWLPPPLRISNLGRHFKVSKKNYKYQNYFRSLEGILNTSNSKSTVNPYFQRKLPESAPTHIRNNLERHLGFHKVSNQQWSAYLDLDYPDCLDFFASRNKNLK